VNLEPYLRSLERTPTERWTGEVAQVVGLLVESRGPCAAVGDFCEIQTSEHRAVRAQVIGFRDGRVLLMPLEETSGIQLGSRVIARGEAARASVALSLMGRVLDGFGEPMDRLPPVEPEAFYDIYAPGPGPLERSHIEEQLVTGIRAIDSMIPLGKGQRLGIFGGSGVGKSTLLGAMSRYSSADVNVIALIGERNREVRDFLEKELSADGLAKSVVIVAPSDRPAPLRIRAAFLALAISEFFRDQGKDVLLVIDSVTRLAMAQREIGLAAGEPPSQKGYTPSVFNLLPKIFERAGCFPSGSITGFFTVLVEGDDFNEPICDAVRAILDGHVVLSRELGAMGHYPAIDVLQSVSRLASRISTPEQKAAALRLREAMATYHRSEDLLSLGAYASGSNPQLDRAIQLRPQLLDFLKQSAEEHAAFDTTLQQMVSLAAAVSPQEVQARR
jgi:FliI/YscN family ATPase